MTQTKLGGAHTTIVGGRTGRKIAVLKKDTKTILSEK
jgi:hypothetical protein